MCMTKFTLPQIFNNQKAVDVFLSCTSPHLLCDKIGGKATDQWRHATTTVLLLFSFA